MPRALTPARVSDASQPAVRSQVRQHRWEPSAPAALRPKVPRVSAARPASQAITSAGRPDSPAGPAPPALPGLLRPAPGPGRDRHRERQHAGPWRRGSVRRDVLAGGGSGLCPGTPPCRSRDPLPRAQHQRQPSGCYRQPAIEADSLRQAQAQSNAGPPPRQPAAAHRLATPAGHGHGGLPQSLP
jgi:hypothetical protein